METYIKADMAQMTLMIAITGFINTEQAEDLEESLADFLSGPGRRYRGFIEDHITGNTTRFG